jgi:hypothetical protein
LELINRAFHVERHDEKPDVFHVELDSETTHRCVFPLKIDPPPEVLLSGRQEGIRGDQRGRLGDHKNLEGQESCSWFQSDSGAARIGPGLRSLRSVSSSIVANSVSSFRHVGRAYSPANRRNDRTLPRGREGRRRMAFPGVSSGQARSFQTMRNPSQSGGLKLTRTTRSSALLGALFCPGFSLGFTGRIRR